MRSRSSLCCSVIGPCISIDSSSAKPPIALRGVRNSCDIAARNSLFALFDASDSARRLASSIAWSSERLRSVRSRVTFANPTRVPLSSRSAVITTFAQKREPSFFIRQPSSSTRPSRVATSSSHQGFLDSRQQTLTLSREPGHISGPGIEGHGCENDDQCLVQLGALQPADTRGVFYIRSRLARQTKSLDGDHGGVTPEGRSAGRGEAPDRLVASGYAVVGRFRRGFDHAGSPQYEGRRHAGTVRSFCGDHEEAFARRALSTETVDGCP